MPSLSSFLPLIRPQDWLSGAREVLDGVRKRRAMVLGVWVAFWLGVLGTSVIQEAHKPFVSPEVRLDLKPSPLPLVLGKDPEDLPLAKAPDLRVEERAAEGHLPIAGANGLVPYGVYAYPFDRDDQRPRISLVLTGLGPQSKVLDLAMHKLPGSVDLVISPSTPDLASVVSYARQKGHEVLLGVAADAASAPDGSYDDAGPGALRQALSLEENLQRLRLAMARTSGFVGLYFEPQAAVLQQDDVQRALEKESQNRGLIMLSLAFPEPDPEAHATSLLLKPAQRLDLQLTPEGVDLALSDLEQRAKEQGAIVAVAEASPLMIDRLAHWLPDVTSRGYASAPLSALVPLPKIDEAKAHATASTGHEASPHGESEEGPPTSGHEAASSSAHAPASASAHH